MTTYSSPRDQAATATAGAIARLEGRYLAQDSYARAALAQLRRSTPGDVIASSQTWPYVFAALAEEEALPTSSTGVSPVEAATHAALVLWASHQQSRPAPVNVRGVSLGQAVGLLSSKLKREAETMDAGVQRRFTSVTTASSFSSRTRALAQLVSLMKANGVGLDYPRLAADLVDLQTSNHRQGVLLRWVRDLHRLPPDRSITTEVAAVAQEQE